MSVDLPIFPYGASTGAEVDITWSTVINTSESSIAGRFALNDLPLRQFHVTMGPDDVAEVRAIFLACKGPRYPCAIRDWTDYAFTDQVLTWAPGVSSDTTAQLQQLYQPATGGRSFTQPILVVDQSEVALTLKVNGVTYGGTFTLRDYGIVDLHSVLTSGDVLTASGQKLIPACFTNDTLTSKALVNGLLSIQDVQLREIFQAELQTLAGG